MTSSVQPSWRVTYLCTDGGHGWGETGHTVNIIFKEYDEKKFMDAKPGGWVIQGVTKCPNS